MTITKTHLLIRSNYTIDPKLCQGCGVTIPFEKRVNSYCSSSCAATVNNRLHPKRKPEGKCIECGALVYSGIIFCPIHSIKKNHKPNEKSMRNLTIRKRSWTDSQLIEAIRNNNNMKSVSLELGLSAQSAGYICARANKLGIDYSHFTDFYGSRKNGTVYKSKRFTPILDFLVYGSNIKTYALKLRLINENILDNKCQQCGIETWNNKPAPLELDHKDGDRFNNQLDNLRILCANCHAQTDTYKAKNIKNRSKFSTPQRDKYLSDRKRYNHKHHHPESYI